MRVRALVFKDVWIRSKGASLFIYFDELEYHNNNLCNCSMMQILKNVDWPEQFPFKKEDFQRFDE